MKKDKKQKISGSPLPQIPSRLAELEFEAQEPDGERLKNISRVRRTFKTGRCVKNSENPVFRHQLGVYRLRKNMLLLAVLFSFLYLILPVCYIILPSIPNLNRDETLSLIAAILHLLLWVLLVFCSIIQGSLSEGEMPRSMLRDIYMTFLSALDVGHAIYRARLNRFFYLVLALVPFEVITYVFCYRMNASAAKESFFPLILFLFLLDLFVTMAVNLIVGLRNQVTARSDNAGQLKTWVLSFVYYPLIFMVWLTIFGGITLALASVITGDPVSIQLTKSQSISWLNISEILILVIIRASYIIIFRTGYALRSHAIYMRKFEDWLRKTVVKEA